MLQLFMKIKNQFNQILSIFAFFSMIWHIYFWHKYILTSHDMKFKNVIFLVFNFFGFWPTIICKKLWKSFIIMTWLKFTHGTFEKNTIWQQSSTPHSVLSSTRCLNCNHAQHPFKEIVDIMTKYTCMINFG